MGIGSSLKSVGQASRRLGQAVSEDGWNIAENYKKIRDTEQQQAEAEQARIDAEKAVRNRQSTVTEWFNDKKFVEFINAAPDGNLSPDAMQDIEHNPDTFKTLEQYHTLYKKKKEIESGVKKVFEAALATEFKGIGAKEKGTLPPDLWENIQQELSKEMLQNPEGVLELEKQMTEQAARLENIKKLEQSLAQLKGSKQLQELKQHAAVLEQIPADKLQKRPELTLEQRAAYDAVAKYQRTSGIATKFTPDTLAKLEKEIQQATQTEQQLATAHDQIRQAADEVFGNHVYGEMLINYAKQRHAEHFNQITTSLSSNENGAVDKAIAYLEDIDANKSHLDVKSSINVPNTAADLEALREAKQQAVRAEFEAKLMEVVLSQTTFDKLDTALDKLLAPATIGNIKGFAEVKPVLEEMFKNIYDAIPGEKKSQKWTLTLFLKKHNLHGSL